MNVALRWCVLSTLLQLAKVCEQRFGVNGEGCFLFPTLTVANHCRTFIIRQAAKDNLEFSVRITQFLLHPDDKYGRLSAELHIVLFPADQVQYARPFWSHTGLGISSRYAEHCLSLLPEATVPASPTICTGPKSAQVYDSVKEERKPLLTASDGALSEVCSTRPEEHYGRNLSQDAVTFAKRTLRRRIAGMFLRDGPADQDTVRSVSSKLQPSTHGLGVTEDDVYLYPTGMAAIWNAHQMMLAMRPAAKAVAFGFVFN